MDAEYTRLAEIYGQIAVRLVKLQSYARRVSGQSDG
jgi:hypothetical protein